MGEALEQLDLRLEKVAEARAFAVEHRNIARDVELGAELEKLRTQRVALVELERLEQDLRICESERRDAVHRREWDVSREYNRQIDALRRERASLKRRMAEQQPVHLCHARGCPKAVDPRLLMCAGHWSMVPRELQLAVWHSYKRGQEVRKDPSSEYLQAARESIEAVAKREQAG